MTVQIALDYRESWEPRGILAESAASIVLSIGVARADSGYDVLGNRAPLFRSELVRDCSTGLPLVLNYLLNQSSDISRDARPAAVLNRLRPFFQASVPILSRRFTNYRRTLEGGFAIGGRS